METERLLNFNTIHKRQQHINWIAFFIIFLLSGFLILMDWKGLSLFVVTMSMTWILLNPVFIYHYLKHGWSRLLILSLSSTILGILTIGIILSQMGFFDLPSVFLKNFQPTALVSVLVVFTLQILSTYGVREKLKREVSNWG